MSGYTNSQTWEAWLDVYNVSWNNTSFIFLASVALSAAIIIVSWILPFNSSVRNRKSKVEIKIDEPEDDEQELQRLLDIAHQAPSDVKKAQRRALERNIETHMSDEQRLAEREAQSQQLAAIFKMMKEQEEKFGETTIDEIKDQMKLYCG
ncbi:matrix-remodeling-associated protein 7-like [Penaeus chinensis]|uniref:matrix-remodeling-associated protein 7-like n=1 Tax=Penaeus chinensis TaxID=139456 RepID=UPI001FB83AC0|nr:matrix-remodeling-associated protein 7-like [Penaeus chinensis]